jgi:putative ABC transport system permease protein
VSTVQIKARNKTDAAPEKAPGDRPGALRRRSLTAMLAFLDLKDDALLSVCLVCAVAAVLAPIMILAGLKFGLIEIMRDQLIQDPAFRLITPSEAQIRPEAFFNRLRTRPDVAFVQPNVNLSGTSVRIAAGNSERAETFDLMPTGAGDPLITENDGVPPLAGEVTLTRPGAEALGLTVGQEAVLQAFRSIGGRREQQRVPLKVRSILSAKADAERRAYVSLDLVQDIENYRAGIPVARRGWLGPARPPQQSFDAAHLLLEAALDEVELHSLCVRHSFISCRDLGADEAASWTGPWGGPAAQVVHLSNGRKPLRGQQLADMTANLGDRNFELRPSADDLRVTPPGSSVPIKVRTEVAESWPRWRHDASFAQVNRARVPAPLAAALRLSPGDTVRLGVMPHSDDDATRELAITVIFHEAVEGSEIVLHPSLAGMLLQARIARLAFDDALGTLLAADIGFRGFRLYARSIDDVPAIARTLGDQATPVRAKTEQIEQLQRLDVALTRIILIIAIVALVGGTAALVASIYAAVERKKADLSLLRLLGFSRAGIFGFPILQCLMVSVAGYLAAIALFFSFAALINAYYSTDLPIKGNICRLELVHFSLFALAILVIAGVSSLVAAHRAMQIDPAEALRHE